MARREGEALFLCFDTELAVPEIPAKSCSSNSHISSNAPPLP